MILLVCVAQSTLGGEVLFAGGLFGILGMVQSALGGLGVGMGAFAGVVVEWAQGWQSALLQLLQALAPRLEVVAEGGGLLFVLADLLSKMLFLLLLLLELPLLTLHLLLLVVQGEL